MGFSVEKLSNESVIIISLLNPHTAEEIPAIHQETMALAQQIDGIVYRVVDMTRLNWSFKQFKHAIDEGSKKRDGGAADTKFKSYYVVGNNFLPRLLAHGLKNQNLDVISVATRDDALHQIRATISE